MAEILTNKASYFTGIRLTPDAETNHPRVAMVKPDGYICVGMVADCELECLDLNTWEIEER